MEPDLAEHFEAALTQVRTVPVETRVIPLSQLRVAPPRKMAINSIEASLRLDAVASAGETGGRQKHGLAVTCSLITELAGTATGTCYQAGSMLSLNMTLQAGAMWNLRHAIHMTLPAASLTKHINDCCW